MEESNGSAVDQRDDSPADSHAGQGTSINSLPGELMMEIFGYLSYKERLQLEAVCKSWRQWSQETWKNLKWLMISPPPPPPKDSKSNLISHGDCLSLTTEITSVGEKIVSLCGTSINRLTILDRDNRLPRSVYIKFTKSCRNLQELNVEKSKGDTTLLSLLLALNLQLKSFRVQGYDDVENLHLLSYLPQNLKFLDVHYVGEYPVGPDADEYASALETMQDLRSLKTPANETVLTSIGTLENLTSLTIWSYGITSMRFVSQLMHITELHNLVYLNLSRITEILYDSFLVQLSQKCQKIKRLFIAYFVDANNITKVGLNAVSSLPRLRQLDLRGHRHMSDNILLKLKQLKSLKICTKGTVTDTGVIKFIEQNEQLAELKLHDFFNDQVRKILTEAVNIINRRGSRQTKVLKIFVNSEAVAESFDGVSEYLEVKYLYQ